jgi:exosortase C (VPDSG-CTERM-specific)
MENSQTQAAVVPRAQTIMSQLFTLRTHLGRFVWFAILLTALFSKGLIALVIRAANSNLHSYILLVPVISAYLIYNRRDRLPSNYSSSPGLATIPLLGGLAALAFAVGSASFGDNNPLTSIALAYFCLIVAGAFLFLGRNWMKAVAFPFAFLIFIVPMPDSMADILENASKLASTEAAGWFFDITGTPVLREGTIFQLADIAIKVGQECSGIRSTLVLFLTSLVGANLFLKSWWRKALFIGFVIPLGILRNGFRVWFIGTLCIHFGPQMIHSVFHRRGGPVFFTLSLIPLFLLLWWLHRGEERKQQTSKVTVR